MEVGGGAGDRRNGRSFNRLFLTTICNAPPLPGDIRFGEFPFGGFLITFPPADFPFAFFDMGRDALDCFPDAFFDILPLAFELFGFPIEFSIQGDRTGSEGFSSLYRTRKGIK